MTWLSRVRAMVRGWRKPARSGRQRPGFRPACQPLEERTLLTLAVVHANMVSDHMRGANGAPGQVQGLLGQLRGDGSFSDLEYSGTTNASADHYRVHSRRLKTLAQAYHWNDTGNPWYRSASLRDTIIRGWNYLAYTAPGVDRVPNWWHRQIAVPNDLGAGLVLARDEVPAAARTAVLDRYFARQRVWSFDLGNYGRVDGANLTWRATAALAEGVLRDSTARAQDVRQRISDELFAFLGDGIMQDLSFRQHNLLIKSQWYSGGYGMSFTSSMTELLRWTRGSDFAFGTPAVEQFLRYVVDHLSWLTRRDGFELTSQGREISRLGIAVSKARWLRDLAQELLTLGQRRQDLQLLIDRYDRGPTEDNHLHGNRAFWTTDGMVHQRRHWMAGLRLLSERTLRPETMNNENRLAFYEADGFLSLYQDGDEYGSLAGNQQIFPVWDWKKLPGTTVEQSPGPPPVVTHTIFNLPRLIGQGTFVGGASDGTYGLAAMDYRRATVNVSARKAWFFFDDEVIALGAGINAPSALHPVHTTLNQVVLDGPITVRQADDTEQTLGLGASVNLANPKWLHHDGRGYVFLTGHGDVGVRAQTQTGNWSDIGSSSGAVSQPVFTAWVNHGVRPQAATYAYAVVANATPQSLARYHAAPPVAVLQNTPDVQAVCRGCVNRGGQTLAHTQAAFYAPGWLPVHARLTVRAEQPVLLLLHETAQGLRLTVADPTQSRREVQLDVTVPVRGDGAVWLPEQGVTRITVSLPAGGHAGASVTREFLYLSPAPFPVEIQGLLGGGAGKHAGALKVCPEVRMAPVPRQTAADTVDRSPDACPEPDPILAPRAQKARTHAAEPGKPGQQELSEHAALWQQIGKLESAYFGLF